jgi:hypothetical protein
MAAQLPRSSSYPLAARLLVGAAALLLSVCASAYRNGAPVCQVDLATMSSSNMGSSNLTSPNGWALQGPATYSPGSPITVSLSNGSAGRQFRGLLLWAETGGAGGLGTWVVDDGAFRNPDGCAWSLTHSSAEAKAQRSFSFRPPSAGTGPLVFRAFVVEECGIFQCIHEWVDVGMMIVAEATAAAPANYTALWWNPAESGWGLNLNHQGDTLFGTLFTYDATGAPMWLVMSAGLRQSNGTTYGGTLYRTTGPAFNASPFTPLTAANLTTVGTMSIAFSGTQAATLNYTVNGVAVTKSIQPQVYGTRQANCAATTASRSALVNYQDLWWNSAESGWGVNVTHQDNTLFATLFTYDATGKGMWLVMSAGARQSDGSFLGDLYRTTGSAFNAQPFTPLTAANLSKVGTMQFRFTDGEHGTLSYSFNGIVQDKAITRQVFSGPLPSCT